jgi:hypothetical protein
MENEDFKIIELRETTFQLFRDGRIFRVKKSGITPVALTPHLAGDCKYYFRVSIKSKETKAHRLLAKAFLGLDIENKAQFIDHLDGNGLNNSFENLRLVTSRENQRNMKGVCGISRAGNSFRASIMNNEGKRLYKTYKIEELAMTWRKEKELEFGYLTRASGGLSPQ